MCGMCMYQGNKKLHADCGSAVPACARFCAEFGSFRIQSEYLVCCTQLVTSDTTTQRP